MSYNRIKSFGDFHSLNEGKIPMYMPGDNLKASKSMRVVDVARDFKKFLDSGKPFTAIVNTESVKGSDPLKPEMDVIGVEPDEIIVLRDFKGREFKVKPHRVAEIVVGDSVQHKIFLNLVYLVDGKHRMKVIDFDGKAVTVTSTEGKQQIPLEEWNKMSKTLID